MKESDTTHTSEHTAGRHGRRMWILTAVVLAAALSAVATQALAGDDLAEVRAATARYHRLAVAQEAGWEQVSGLDHCFDNPGVGGMGYHYINTALFDAVTDHERPEALVYAPGPDGRRRLAAVEWIVPADAWAETGRQDPPAVLDRPMHLNDELGVWVLHAWVFRHNAAGMFEDWNPAVSCPSD